jgi:hypothetical protein
MDITERPEKKKELQDTLLGFYKNKNIIDDELESIIYELIEEIIKVQEFMFCELNAKFSTLNGLNETLELLGEPPRESITQAKRVFKRLYVNIYDVLDEKYYMRVSKIKFTLDIIENPSRVFSLHIAKRYPHLKCFLKVINLNFRRLYRFVNKHPQHTVKSVNTHTRFI